MIKSLSHLTLLLLAILLSGSCKRGGTDGGGASIDTIPMMVQQIKECSRLYTAEYKVHKIITHSDTSKISATVLGQKLNLNLPGGRRKVAIPIDAVLKAYIDFSNFSEDNVRSEGGKIYIDLPNPHVVITSSKIDHEGIKKYVSIIRSDFSDEELALYEKQGRQDIINDIPNLGILNTARRSAASQLLPLISMLGIPQENIVITFVEPSEEKGGLTWKMD
ncbi:MAG: DUF4230 domain-containing protein [Prevotella sp.]|nr:DUF4230 domain-containing protein [Bacteroidaceae bacterium]MBR4269835.1 DUF4230 domain-containing protein [Prevotella sp.]